MHGHVTVLVQLASSLILMVPVFVMQHPNCLIRIGKGWHVCMPCVSYEYIYSFGLISVCSITHIIILLNILNLHTSFPTDDAAHTVIMEMGHVLLNQKYLEAVPCTEENGFTKCNDPPEIAITRLEELITEAFDIRNAAFDALKTNAKWLDKATVVSQAVSTAILTAITVDGSNYDNDYQDTSGYEVKSWSLPVPVVSSTMILNFCHIYIQHN